MTSRVHLTECVLREEGSFPLCRRDTQGTMWWLREERQPRAQLVRTAKTVTGAYDIWGPSYIDDVDISQ